VLVHRNPGTELPAVSTFAKIFSRQGLVRPRRRSRRTPRSSNALWCVDFEGHFAVGRVRCQPPTVMDAYSRHLIACATVRRPMRFRCGEPAACSEPSRLDSAFDRFRRDYDHERPHAAVGQQPPRLVVRALAPAAARTELGTGLRLRRRLIGSALHHELLGLEPIGPDAGQPTSALSLSVASNVRPPAASD
jgi:hypothetical protein